MHTHFAACSLASYEATVLLVPSMSVLLQSGRLPCISDALALQPVIEAFINPEQTINARIMSSVELAFVLLGAVLLALDMFTVFKRGGTCKSARYALLLLGKTVARLGWLLFPLERS